MVLESRAILVCERRFRSIRKVNPVAELLRLSHLDYLQACNMQITAPLMHHCFSIGMR